MVFFFILNIFLRTILQSIQFHIFHYFLKFKIQKKKYISIKATSPGAIIGAAFGGAVCGLTVTIVVFMCMGRKSFFFKKT